MSNSKMLIDATHPEETRVVVQRNGRVEEFDFESAARKLLRGNIYLAKVTRVEPSLQAAFVDYGGNRHGFLAFNEIHPDYYQIPVADRQALIDEEAAAEAELEAAADRRAESMARRSRPRDGGYNQEPNEAAPSFGTSDSESDSDIGDMEPSGEESNIVDVEEDEHIEEIGGEGGDDDTPSTFAAAVPSSGDTISELAPHVRHAEPEADDVPDVSARREHNPEAIQGATQDDGTQDDGTDDDSEDDEDDEQHDDTENRAGVDLSGESDASEPRGETRNSDLMEEVAVRPRRRPRSYKIQEVIKRRQVILVQVVKEERGNKGAALTTYLSLAGRYTVLMPNTARGGGISRKITNPQDRKRLKAIAQELEVPEGMGLIIRTAGAARTKQEIKRDFEYLLRLWENVRDLTLQSTAPSLVYEEGDLIKRSIRDLYNKDVEEVVVAGDAGYQEAAAFMHMLLPSHAKNVVPYKDATPLFARYAVERQLNAMFTPQVTLRSGGYIVINQTEALVAIDVNSGKSTREFSIEETALATNLEASDEIARQLKLRDLAGLIVIDFIDMEEKRNNRSVERRLKDALRHDRARIQLGRISHFGLMEMSRQRLRTGVLEGSTTQCAHCQGTGTIRSTESIALAVLRGIEDAITAGSSAPIIATTTPAVALYILNSKRAYVTEMEARHGFLVTILGAERIQGANFTIERGIATALPQRRTERAAVNMDWGFEGEGEDQAPAHDGNNIEEVGDDTDDAGDTQVRESSGRDRYREPSRENTREPTREHSRDVSGGEDDGNQRRGRRRRRRGGGGGGRDGERGVSRGGERGIESGRPDFQGTRTPVAPAGVDDENGDEPEIIEIGAEANDSDNSDTAIDHGSDVDENGEKRGRRRRRGRRGGRRGRGDREGGEARHGQGGDRQGNERHGSERAQGPDSGNQIGGNGGVERTSPSAPGFEPQPDVPGPSVIEGGRNYRPREGRDRDRQSDRRPEGGGGRIWDAPVQNGAPAPAGEARSNPGAYQPLDQTSNFAEPPALAPRSETRPEPRQEPRQETRPEPRNETAPEPKADATPARPRHETGSSEPRIERVVLKPDHPTDLSSESEPAPQRKGWWQRNFGGE